MVMTHLLTKNKSRSLFKKGIPNAIFDTQVQKQIIALIYLLRNKNDTMNWTLLELTNNVVGQIRTSH